MAKYYHYRKYLGYTNIDLKKLIKQKGGKKYSRLSKVDLLKLLYQLDPYVLNAFEI